MTPLNQQLEDKKKGCGKKFGVRDERIQEPFICGTKQGEITIKCPQCRAEIAILEQAIAEIKNIQSQQQNDRKINLGETTLVDGMQTIVTQENISADISNLLQKQRQEILKLIKQEISKDAYSYTFECRLNNFLKNGLKKQLNQPKTEE